ALAAALPAAAVQAPDRAPAARSRYLQTFHPDVVTRALLDIYRSVVVPARSS
ncbi:MAG: glycosyl transferase family 1, partial [Natronosporangium sp.]